MASQKVKAMFYGINGTGLGHLSRLLNIARAARELLHAMGLKADFHFISSSEAPQLAWDFPVYKLPSKTVIRDCDTDNGNYAAHSRFFISNLVALLRPDLLVMDTMPQGSFGEFTSLRPFCRSAVFVNRHKKARAAADQVHLQHLPLYDLVLTPDDPANAHRYSLPAAILGRNVFTGVIHGYDRQLALDRETVRQRFGVRPEQRLVYVSAGGGGDPEAVRDLQRIISALAPNPKNFLLIGYGPLYRGEKTYRTNVVPLSDCDNRILFGGIDLAISAAGYNTYQELLAAGVPTAFFAQEKGMDDQAERIRLGCQRGWNWELNWTAVQDEDERQALIASKAELLSMPEAQRDIRQALRQRADNHGRLRAAVELLSQHSCLSGSPVERERLLAVAALRRDWPADAGVSFIQAMRCLAIWQEQAENAGTSRLERERLIRGYRYGDRTDGLTAACLERAVELARFQQAHGLTERQFRDLVSQSVRHLHLTSDRVTIDVSDLKR